NSLKLKSTVSSVVAPKTTIFPPRFNTFNERLNVARPTLSMTKSMDSLFNSFFQSDAVSIALSAPIFNACSRFSSEHELTITRALQLLQTESYMLQHHSLPLE